MKNDLDQIIALINEVIISYSKPAIYISGGIDSTILLHHLSLKTDEKINTYTYGFKDQPNEFKNAERVAKYYNTNHKEVVIKDFIKRFSEIQSFLDRPRFNVQCYWLAEQAKRDGVETVYVGEGLDEHFGGYWNKPDLSYIASFADHYIYIVPTYKQIHNYFGLKCEIPFSNLDARQTIAFWDYKREKQYLRNAYKGIIPDFVVNLKKHTGSPNWRLLWDNELNKEFPNIDPKDDKEIRHFLNVYTIEKWRNVN